MKYLITSIFGFLTLLLAVGTIACLYQGFTDGWAWFLVALGIGSSAVVAGLITSVGLEITSNE